MKLLAAADHADPSAITTTAMITTTVTTPTPRHV